MKGKQKTGEDTNPRHPSYGAMGGGGGGGGGGTTTNNTNTNDTNANNTTNNDIETPNAINHNNNNHGEEISSYQNSTTAVILETTTSSYDSSDAASTISSKFSSSILGQAILDDHIYSNNYNKQGDDYDHGDDDDEDEELLYPYSDEEYFNNHHDNNMNGKQRRNKAYYHRQNTRIISQVLFMIVFICIVAIAFLASPLSNNNNKSNGKQSITVGGGGKYSTFSESSSRVFQTTTSKVPFNSITRETESIPASSIVNPSLFHPSLRNTHYNSQEGGNNISNVQPLLKVPFPTGAFYTNLLLSKTTSDHSISYPIMVYPYAFKWSPTSLIVSYPSIHRIYDDISIRDIFQPDLTFHVDEEMKNRFCTYYDSLSVTLRYTSFEEDELLREEGENEFNTGNINVDMQQQNLKQEGSEYETYLVQGSPYITIKYTNATPVITALSIFQSFHCLEDEDESFGICSKVTKSSSSSSSLPMSEQDVTLTGVQFVLETQENLKWLIFASEPIELKFGGVSKRTLKATKSFNGVLRFALVPPLTTGNDKSTNATGTSSTTPIPYQPPYPAITSLLNSTAVKSLIYYSHLYPVGGTITWDFKTIPLTSTASSSSSSSSSSIANKLNLGIGGLTWHEITTGRNYNYEKQTTKPIDNKSRTVGTLSFQYTVKSMFDCLNNMNSTSCELPSSRTAVKDDLFLLALPHHKQVLPSKMILTDFDAEYHCIKGAMTPVVGTQWTYDELLTNITFDGDDITKKLLSMDDDVMDTIIDQVENDLTRVLPTLTENVYGFGKQVARLANLAKIAHDLQLTLVSSTNATVTKNDQRLAKLMSLSTQSAGLLHRFLTAFLNNKSSDNLVYDANFGGIITRNGLLNMQEDFGNGWYNDHHFHYGYILYASAIMAKINSTFVDEYGIYVDSILNDVAHESNQNSDSIQGSFFPFTRHKAWYDGHSYASGLFPFADGKSQESSSESVNCYYGAYLWSLVSAERKLAMNTGVNSNYDRLIRRTNFMKLLLAMEIRSTKTYWHMIPPSETKGMGSNHTIHPYNPSFEQSLMVGNLGMMDVTVSTWFGPEKLYVHMINFLPVTAITRELFDPDYVKLEFDHVLDPIYDNVEMAWKGYVIADKAIIDSSSAWDDATKLTSYELDSALSQSQVYYWISTMDGFEAPTSKKSSPTSGLNITVGANGASSCMSHTACSSAGLSGECCPTATGIMLGCCDEVASPGKGNKISQSSSSSSDGDYASCGQHQACTSAGLTGVCCPTEDGIMLGCCSS